jgi:hypothetical protein
MEIAEINKLTDLLRLAYNALQNNDLNTPELRKEISDNIYTLSVFKHQDKPKLAIPCENTSPPTEASVKEPEGQSFQNPS